MFVYGQSGCIRTKVVLFGQSGFIVVRWLYSGKMVVFGQSLHCKTVIQKCCIRAKKLLYSGKSGCTRAKVVVVLCKCGCIRAKVLVVFGQSGCIRGKVVVFGQKWLYSGKVVVFVGK